jgi:hypothetical protein
VLLGYLAPNRPDIAWAAAEATLNSDSGSELGGSDDEEKMRDRPNLIFNNQATKIPELTKIARNTLTRIDSPSDKSDQGETLHHRGWIETGSVNADGVDNEQIKRGPTDANDINAAISIQGLVDTTTKDRRTLKIKTFSDKISIEGSTATSPNLRQFRISAAESSPGQILPVINKSPPRSISRVSPDGIQSLPSLKTALAESETRDPDILMKAISPMLRTDFPPKTTQSPSLNRPPYVSQSMSTPHPCRQLPSLGGKEMSGISPPESTQLSFFRSSKPDIPYTRATILSDQQLIPQSTEGSNAYPISIEHRMNVDNEKSKLSNGLLQTKGPLTSSGFKCAHPGCTALPFQTQYLLKYVFSGMIFCRFILTN